VVLSLGNDNNPAEAVQITLPFAAFDLSVKWPIVETETPYFPIRRAANDTQYTLGRTFLQEAYVIADYERSNFSVHQTLFPSETSTSPNILPILAPGTNTSTPPSSSSQPASKLGAGAIAGIVIGAIAGIALLALLAFFYLRRRKRSKKDPIFEAPADNVDLGYVQPHKEHTELPGEEVHEMAQPADKNENRGGGPLELDSAREFVLLSDDARMHELDGEGVKGR
jgi:hypothetical protein